MNAIYKVKLTLNAPPLLIGFIMNKKLFALIFSLILLVPWPGSAINGEDKTFSIVTVNINGVPDILRLPTPVADQEITVKTEHLRWEESFYFMIEPREQAVSDIKVEQKQINCLSHSKINLDLLKKWPRRESSWREMNFVGTNRYKGAEFDNNDLSNPSLESLEAFIIAQNAKDKVDNLAIAREITLSPESHSYHCETLIKITQKGNNKKPITYRIEIY
jgi:hypothetical protein